MHQEVAGGGIQERAAQAGLGRAISRQHQEPGLIPTSSDIRQPLQGRAVPPVQILEDQDQRPFYREDFQGFR
jgi:hypothetical protein